MVLVVGEVPAVVVARVADEARVAVVGQVADGALVVLEAVVADREVPADNNFDDVSPAAPGQQERFQPK